MQRKSSTHPIVEVKWEDSYTQTSWGPRTRFVNQDSSSPCRTCGYLIEKTKEVVRIALSAGDDPMAADFADVMSIPMKNIRKFKYIRR